MSTAYYGSCTCASGENCLTVELCFNVKKALLHYSGNTDSESSTSKVWEPISLSLVPPLFPYQGNSVVLCAAEVEEEFPFV